MLHHAAASDIFSLSFSLCLSVCLFLQTFESVFPLSIESSSLTGMKPVTLQRFLLQESIDYLCSLLQWRRSVSSITHAGATATLQTAHCFCFRLWNDPSLTQIMMTTLSQNTSLFLLQLVRFFSCLRAFSFSEHGLVVLITEFVVSMNHFKVWTLAELCWLQSLLPWLKDQFLVTTWFGACHSL